MSSDSHFSTADCEMTEWECANVSGSFFEGVCFGVHPDNCKGKIIRPAHPNFMKSLEEQKEKNRKIRNEAQNLKNIFGVAPARYDDPAFQAAYKPIRMSNLLGLYKTKKNLLKFPSREEELKGLFNVPSNKTRTRRRKNRKTLRKRR
jgi:hypothetical protein